MKLQKKKLQKWLPRLKYNHRRLIRMEQDVLNSVSAPIQAEDERYRDSTISTIKEDQESDDGILKFSANEILNTLCNNGKLPPNKINATTTRQ